MDLVEIIYNRTSGFPKEEVYGLTAQLRRSAVSVPSNIAEGFMRKNTREYIQFIHIAQGSLGELDTQIEIAKRLSYVDDTSDIDMLIILIKKQLFSLLNVLKQKTGNPQ
ncbi:four helix bundle protein [Parapedobacter composti]|uniref:Four helix bundle protein n=2 Tax=Parapedobacter composti TaxID=623281 RepID=A0A1I1IMJ2_9SPHI|nr:four helix bundle protein [Parapedobacter composti]